MKKGVVTVGSSRGIGAELAKHLSKSGHDVYGVSRSRSANCGWIQSDMSTPDGIEKVVTGMKGKKLPPLF